MEEALRAALLAASGVSALVADRLDWGLRPAAVPSVRLQLVGKVPFYTYSGRDSLTPYRVQADCFGRRYGEAKLVARAIEVAVDALGRPEFDACFLLSERDDQDTDAAGQPLHRASLDFRIWHHTTQP